MTILEDEKAVHRALLRDIASDSPDLGGFTAALTQVISKAVPDLGDVNERAAELAGYQAAGLIKNLTNEQRVNVQDLIRLGIQRGWDNDQLARRIKGKIGLHPRYAQAVEKQRLKNLADGMAPGQANRLAKQYADRLRSSRALTIARYEVQKALNDANRELWLEQQEVGDLTPYAVRIFKTHPDERRCKVCKSLNGRHISLKDTAITPPLHPNCRCWEELKDEGIIKSRSNISKHGTKGQPGYAALFHPGIEGRTKASPIRFYKEFEDAFKGSPYIHHVTHYTPAELADFDLVLINDGKAGVAIKRHADGKIEATALFNQSNEKGVGLALLRFVVKNYGVNYVECFGPTLPDLYKKAKFKDIQVWPFDPEEAPDGWNYTRFSQPSYHMMTIGGNPVTKQDDSGIHLKPATDLPTYEELKASIIRQYGQEWFDKYGHESIKAALVVSGNAPRSAYSGEDE